MLPFGTGALPSPPDKRDYRVAAAVAPIVIPTSYRVPGMEAVPVLNQGLRSTCVAHSLVTIQMWHDLKESGFRGTLSREFLYDLSKQRDGIPHLPGTYPRVALQIQQELGVPREELRPHHVVDPADMLTWLPSDKEKLDAERHKIANYARVTSLEAGQTALLSNGPLLLAIPVTTKFMRSTLHDGVVSSWDGDDQGGHAMVWYGWETGPNGVIYLRLRNSWGTDWGNGGDGLLPSVWPRLFEDCWTSIDAKSPPPQLTLDRPYTDLFSRVAGALRRFIGWNK